MFGGIRICILMGVFGIVEGVNGVLYGVDEVHMVT